MKISRKKFSIDKPTHFWYNPVIILGSLIAVLATIATIAGFTWSPIDTVPSEVISAWGESVPLHGEGLYRRDTPFVVSIALGGDLVTLTLAIPLLIILLVFNYKKARWAQLCIPGAFTWFLYVYGSLALGTVIYNELHLLYVAISSASIAALSITTLKTYRFLNSSKIVSQIPRQGPAIFLILSGLATIAIWIGPPLDYLLNGTVPARLGHYTSRVTDALDLGLITPSVFVAGWLIWRGRSIGYVLALPLLVLEIMLLPLIGAQVYMQLRFSITLTTAEIVGPTAGFMVLAAGAIWVLKTIVNHASKPLGVLSLLMLFATGAVAQPNPANDSTELARFVHETFPTLADSFGVPGAALAVVRTDGVLAMAGYGVADVRTGTPVDPMRTLFRVASVSKPVTATAVLALAERGALDLHTDVNDQLRVLEVPEAFGVPITPHHLLTHTAGLDERIFGGGSPESAPKLQDYLAASLPGRVYPPGSLHLYSNHGYGLLGALLEDASGEGFPAAMDTEVLEPLEMSNSTFAQPPPAALAPQLATGHVCAGDRATCAPLPYDYVAFAPAGALQTTANDLAKFAAFHLSGLGNALADSTRLNMQAPQWRAHPALTGMAYGWHRGLLGQYEVLRHAGGWAGWSAQMIVVPEMGVGYVVMANTDDRGLLGALATRFGSDFLGGSPTIQVVPDDDLDRYTGTYRLARHVHEGVDRVAILAGFPIPDLQVEAEGDTALLLVTGPSVRRVVPTGDGAFVSRGAAPRRYAFVRNAKGRFLLHGDYASLLPLSWWATRRTTAWILGICGLLLLGALGAAMVRRLRKRTISGVLQQAQLWASAGAVCILVFGVALLATFLKLGPQGLVYGLPSWTRAAFALPLLGSVFALVALVMLVLAIKNRNATGASRFWLAILILAMFIVLLVLSYWGLLGIP